MTEQRSARPDYDPGKEVFMVTPIVYMIFIDDGDNVLLLKRSRGKYGDFWSLPAGHIDEGENAVQATVRESEEELGVSLNESDLDFVHLLHIKDEDGQRMVLSMRPRNWVGEPFNREPHKHTEIGWHSVAELPDGIIPHARNVVTDISNGVNFRETNWPQSE